MNTVEQLIQTSENKCKGCFKIADEIALYNQEKVLKAFWDNKVALRHFAQTSGYGYGDEGRDTLNAIYAQVFGAQRAIVSPSIASGTHALSLGLFGVLRPGDTMLSVTGEPYDTLKDVISGKNIGSLSDFGVNYQSIPLLKNGNINLKRVLKVISENKIAMLYIQRSRGYAWRNSLSVDKIGQFVEAVRSAEYEGCIFVDNCYGEFVEKKEPTEVGADVACGSLIKNPGGGLAPTGGYIVGSEKYISQIEGRVTAPSIGCEVGSYAFGYQYFYQGLFLAPHTVNQAVKGSLLIGMAMSILGYQTLPKMGVTPCDITRSIIFNDEKRLIDFIQSVQEVSPVDSYVSPIPWDMPGYEDAVIMAAGCFVAGSSIELSADAPVKPPYVAYLQGGLTYEHCKIALKQMLKKLI
ncbi:MAG: methionine gamma-lyase family protein [Clostridia bacterium]|nr:methionine gamma-lyase family protein [Clostridia bacterium]